MARNTPWADGCCGPMFIVRRSLPPYPISSCWRATVSIVLMCRRGAFAGLRRPTVCPRLRCVTLLHRRHARRDEHRGLHGHQQRERFAEERLPVGVAERLRARGGPLVEIPVHPEVHGLVELAGLGLPVADVARVLLAA